MATVVPGYPICLDRSHDPIDSPCGKPLILVAFDLTVKGMSSTNFIWATSAAEPAWELMFVLPETPTGLRVPPVVHLFPLVRG